MKTMSKRALVAAVAAALSCSAFAATDPILDKLEKQIAELQKQVQDLKAAQAKDADERKELANQIEAQGKEAVVKGDTPGSIRRAGEETSVHVYGFARLDAVHNFGGRNNASIGDYAAYQPSIALTGSPEASRRGESYMFTKASRFGVEAFTPTKYGSLNTKVEADFYNTTGSGIFRLRHAYGQLGSWLVGQTWSTFMDLDSTPETVDFNGPTGNTSLRQPQIRYTYVTPNAGNFIAALEMKANGGATSGDEMTRTPDLVLRWEKAADWGHVALRGVTTENAIKSENTTGSKRGYGVGLGGHYVLTDTTALLASTSYGKGMGRFFNESVGAAADSTENKVYLPKELGVVVGVQQKFSDTLRGSVTYGQQRTLGGEYITVASGDANRSVKSGTVGLIWAPIANVELGSEFMWSHRETLDGRSGTEPRLNFAATYSFGN
ncbi:DcaP family trimeric outer membrane transporter [Uliginosibacterium sp. 31-16]|uniref:DcaP family trimeric outer membrane transporter n=1 Tax=Uliginosibacterium sp. 31-16 TaxID=3068315 RepID=UPI00273D9D9E|nr:DcaP family trimeric outer membrane transporter [Uliginosibacterium sp. 31-16]MDP5241075.1 DcaP family trimeric outer membrane transporter [Uliginosibacterium sp. 31-16]